MSQGKSKRHINLTDFLSCLLSAWYILLNPGKYNNKNSDKGPGLKFILDSFRLSLDIKKLLAGGILLITISILGVLFFPIKILGLINGITGPLRQIPGFNSSLNSLGNSIARVLTGGVIMAIGILGILLLINSLAFFLQFIGTTTSDAEKCHSDTYSYYSMVASRFRGKILHPVANIMILISLIGLFVALTSYITYISYFGEIFLAGIFPFIVILGVITGLILLLALFSILLSPGAEFETDMDDDSSMNKHFNNGENENENELVGNNPIILQREHPFTRACVKITANFPQFLKGQFLILITLIIFVPLIAGIFSQTIGISTGAIQGLMAFILTGKILNLINMQVSLMIVGFPVYDFLVKIEGLGIFSVIEMVVRLVWIKVRNTEKVSQSCQYYIED